MERGIKHNTHPGEILREEIINANMLTVQEAADYLKVSRVTLSNILNGRASITPNMAIRISQVFGGNANLWVRLQLSYDMREAEKAARDAHLSLSRYQFA
ncbi:transcriptional regulator [Bacteroidia bacterium]|nr:transcriptional regulator [Bacteroidia bacterium]